MTKLSADDDQDMRCCILVSSNMLFAPLAAVALVSGPSLAGQGSIEGGKGGLGERGRPGSSLV
jgi:hypothetical protein